MNCEQIKRWINDFVDGDLSEEQQARLRAHVSNCPACEAELAATRRLVKSLDRIPYPVPSIDFEEKLFARVRSQAKGNPHWFAAGFATAMAASVAMWFAFLQPQPGLRPDASSARFAAADVALTLAQPQRVRLAINSPREVPLVTVTLEIPENFELQGYPERRRLEWQTTLTKGQNILTLPIIPKATGEGTVVAKIAIGERTKEFYVRVRASDGTVQWQSRLGRVV